MNSTDRYMNSTCLNYGFDCVINAMSFQATSLTYGLTRASLTFKLNHSKTEQVLDIIFNVTSMPSQVLQNAMSIVLLDMPVTVVNKEFQVQSLLVLCIALTNCQEVFVHLFCFFASLAMAIKTVSLSFQFFLIIVVQTKVRLCEKKFQ